MTNNVYAVGATSIATGEDVTFLVISASEEKVNWPILATYEGIYKTHRLKTFKVVCPADGEEETVIGCFGPERAKPSSELNVV